LSCPSGPVIPFPFLPPVAWESDIGANRGRPSSALPVVAVKPLCLYSSGGVFGLKNPIEFLPRWCDDVHVLYIERSLLILILSTQAGFSATEIRFDAGSSSELPASAEIFTHITGRASVEVIENRLRLSPGGGTNSARAAIAFPPPDGSGGVKSRELKLESEPFTGSGEEGGRAGVWAGFAASPLGGQTINSPSGSWLGLLIEIKEANDGLYSVTLLERWEVDESGEARLEAGVSSDFARGELCKLTACPTKVELEVEAGMVRVSFTGADVFKVGTNVQGSEGGNEVEKSLQPQMGEVLQGDLDAAFGLANYGDLTETPVLLVKSFSVRQ